MMRASTAMGDEGEGRGEDETGYGTAGSGWGEEQDLGGGGWWEEGVV